MHLQDVVTTEVFLDRGPPKSNLVNLDDMYDESSTWVAPETSIGRPLVNWYSEEAGQRDPSVKPSPMRASSGSRQVRGEPRASDTVPFWFEALRNDIRNILRMELYALKRDMRDGHADSCCDDVTAHGSNPPGPPPAPIHGNAHMGKEIPNVYGPERSLNLRVGDRVVVFKEARTKGRTGTVIDPHWKPGLAQVAMHEADEKGRIKSYKHEDLRLIKEEIESLCAGSRVVIFKAGPTQGRTGTVTNTKGGLGMVQVAMDEAGAHGGTITYEPGDLRLIQERSQTLRVGDRVAVSKQARTKGRTGIVIDPACELGLVQVAMDEEDEKGKTETYKPRDLILIQDLKHIQERNQSLVVGDRVVVSKDKECRDKGKTGTVIDPDWQLGLIQVSMDEADARGRMKSYKPNDLKLIDDAQVLARYSSGWDELTESLGHDSATGTCSVASSARRGGRAYGFSIFEQAIREQAGSTVDRFSTIKTYFPEHDSCAARVVRSKLFFRLIMLVVFCNALWAGFYANGQMNDHSFRQQIAVGWIDLGFNSLFIVEMLLKITGLRGNYFVGKDCAWNWFDFALAIISIIEMIFVGANAGLIARYLFVGRMFRILRLFYVTRVVTELRLVFFVLYQSMATLVWVFIVYFVSTYCFSVIIMQSASTYLEYFTSVGESGFAVKFMYGHVWDSMLVLLNVLTGGDWAEAVEPLAEISWGYKIVFAAYMFFMTFGMLNVVIGVVCDKALFAIGSDKTLRTARHRDNTATFLKAMRRMFKEMDVNSSGYVSLSEFLAYIDNDATGDYLRSYGINTHSPHELFSFLDMQDGESTGEIDCANFIIAMERLAGGVRGSDIVLLRKDVRELKKMITKQFGDPVELKKAIPIESSICTSDSLRAEAAVSSQSKRVSSESKLALE